MPDTLTKHPVYRGGVGTGVNLRCKNRLLVSRDDLTLAIIME